VCSHGYGLTTFSVTNFFYYSLPFKVIAQPTSLRQHFSTTWPDHFSKADCDPGSSGYMIVNRQTHTHTHRQTDTLITILRTPCRWRSNKNALSRTQALKHSSVRHKSKSVLILVPRSSDRNVRRWPLLLSLAPTDIDRKQIYAIRYVLPVSWMTSHSLRLGLRSVSAAVVGHSLLVGYRSTGQTDGRTPDRYTDDCGKLCGQRS